MTPGPTTVWSCVLVPFGLLWLREAARVHSGGSVPPSVGAELPCEPAGFPAWLFWTGLAGAYALGLITAGFAYLVTGFIAGGATGVVAGATVGALAVSSNDDGALRIDSEAADFGVQLGARSHRLSAQDVGVRPLRRARGTLA